MNVEAPANKYHRYDRYDPKAQSRIVQLTRNRLDKLQTHFVHGLLSSDMTHALLEPGKTQGFTTEELKHLKRIPNSYLEQPTAQLDTLDPRSKHLVYKISAGGVAALVDSGRIRIEDAILWKRLQQNNGPFRHDAGTGYITASIALGAKAAGYRFIPWFEILNHQYCKTKDSPNPIEITYRLHGKSHAFVPDQIFGLGRGGERPIFYALETDMGTEQLEEHKLKHSTLAAKYKAYREMWANALHTKHYGVTEMRLLVVANKTFRLENIKEAFRRVANEDAHQGAGPVIFKAVPQLDHRNNQKPPATGHLFDVLK